VCGNAYPQPEASDRLYVDRTCLFVNIPQEVRDRYTLVHFILHTESTQDGMYESMQIPFSEIIQIALNPPNGKHLGSPFLLSLLTESRTNFLGPRYLK
jgi:hypothetical protein